MRNLRDGSVEAVMEGEREDIETLIEWCTSSQPYARVAETKVSWEDYGDEFADFTVKR